MTEMKRTYILTYDRVRELLDYDPDTGGLWWRVATNSRARAGMLAGTLGGTGYWKIGINSKQFLAHRVAWLYVYGTWPPNEIDHINGVKTDNRISNLRLATRIENSGNSRKSTSNSSGFKGVSWHKHRSKWRAHITKHGRQIHLGYFDSTDEAYSAYCRAAEEHFGEFARAA